MTTNRLEAFSDGVLAVVITIMVLELRVPEGHDLAALWRTTGPGLLTYVLSFVYVGIYWNNHHHLFQLTRRITGAVLWANMLLLFWLSLLPFTTAWIDESHFARVPVMVYGIDLLCAALSWYLMQTLIVRGDADANAALARALGRDLKGKISSVLYLAGIAAAAFIDEGSVVPKVVAMGMFLATAVLWLIPDRRMERVIIEEEGR